MLDVETSLPELIEEAAKDALEEMFFMVVFDHAAAKPLEPDAVCARVDFAGDACGSLTIALSRGALLEAAANFLGEEGSSLRNDQIRSVICELANIICGSAVSRWRHDGLFLLAPPALAESLEHPGTVAECTLQLEQGYLWFSLALDEAVLADGLREETNSSSHR